MSNSLGPDGSRALRPSSDTDRDAKIEQLLLSGLDHYFASQYDQAINVWTRVLFLDRSHARARAYIERARSALAEQQRESEERAAALSAAPVPFPEDIDLALNPPERVRAEPLKVEVGQRAHRSRVPLIVASVTVLMLAGVAVLSRWTRGDELRLLLNAFQTAPARPAAPIVQDPPMPLPRRGELALTRARRLAAEGKFRDAMVALDEVRPTDPEKLEADRLRGDLQRQLLALTPVPPPADAKAAQERTGAAEIR